ncbi:hypothetical protein Taro_044315 [Colocasia esculenta]|uniref:Uncharacterized protein n=1 Tax=Colocasia esculenta TaxID=4460 RepID=A0A843WU82_COLES|nr:hypothetical protein [Colocasia esculenta]
MCKALVSGALAPVALEERVVHEVDMLFMWFEQCGTVSLKDNTTPNTPAGLLLFPGQEGSPPLLQIKKPTSWYKPQCGSARLKPLARFYNSPRSGRVWLHVVGVVFLLVRVSRGEMSLGVRIRVSSRPQHPRVLCFPHRHQSEPTCGGPHCYVPSSRMVLWRLVGTSS